MIPSEDLDAFRSYDSKSGLGLFFDHMIPSQGLFFDHMIPSQDLDSFSSLTINVEPPEHPHCSFISVDARGFFFHIIPTSMLAIHAVLSSARFFFFIIIVAISMLS